MNITGKTIWITGASTGIGAQLARELARMGNHVIASGRNETALRRLATDEAGAITPLRLDITDPEAIRRAQRELAVLSHSLDIVIATAADFEYVERGQVDMGVLEHMIRVNYLGAAQTAALGLPLLRRASRPQLAFVSSLTTGLPLGRAKAYGASKAALEYLAQALAVDLQTAGIAVTVIRPGYAASGARPIPLALPLEVASSRIIDGLARRKPLIQFPRRLAWMIRLLAMFPGAWQAYLASQAPATPVRSRRTNTWSGEPARVATPSPDSPLR